jgi:RNA polymerase sigma factor (sigma-70 family)
VRGHEGEYLRRFLVARASGNVEEMRTWWTALITEEFDRVRGWAATEARRRRLTFDEAEEATQRSLTKLAQNMVTTFAGTSMGEWVLATRTLVRNVCIDVQREAIRRRAHETSLDPGHGGDPGYDYDPLARDLARLYHDDDARRADEEDEADRLAEVSDAIDRVIHKLSPKPRAVIELDRQGLSNPEIEERLGMSRDAVYAARSRGIWQLGRLLEEQPA